MCETKKLQLLDLLDDSENKQSIELKHEQENIQEHIQQISSREIFTKQILDSNDNVSVLRVPNDLLNYFEEVNEFMKTVRPCTINMFTIDYYNKRVRVIQQEIATIGKIQNESYMMDKNGNVFDMRILVDLSLAADIADEITNAVNYPRGYVFKLRKDPFKLFSIQVKSTLTAGQIMTYIIYNSGTIVAKESTNPNFLTQWTTIQIDVKIKQNYLIL
ncbi:unnamed protein product [Didymodactylos carnosus]|uniref:Uncharacterized protein n=2 Tax=Didymodactylos carnosus TaxID=1234261 RepID=A0A815H9V2_9BILA|nr:unnamed protein product [Didymodactylos carnosus]CAF4221991.1 unnamed protein product [Didymodactylos carnosus]